MGNNILKRIIVLFVAVTLIIGHPLEIKVNAANTSAKIIENGGDESSRERFHMGRIVGNTETLTTVGYKSGVSITDVRYTTSNSSVVSINQSGKKCTIAFAREGISVITMTCKADGDSVTKKLLASSLKAVDLEGTLKKGATVYEGCSSVSHISSGDSEIKATNNKNREVEIDGECGDFYRVWIDEEIWGDLHEKFGYVYKKDVTIPINSMTVPQTMTIFE